MPRILVIEDDDANRLLFSDYLTYSGFTILALADGMTLEDHLKEFQPNLILLDLGLPKVDGYNLLAKLKASPHWQHLPVVVVSGYAFVDNQKKALALGACHYLVKPVRLKDLVQVIQSTLDQTAAWPIHPPPLRPVLSMTSTPPHKPPLNSVDTTQRPPSTPG